MKRIAIIVVMALMTFTASATSIRYFTYAQASRTVQYLNAQQEMMIYCGYEYEIETYVLINEVWMERVNSAYYELWVFGYDAYTGDEVYMPLDLQCVWLYSAGRMYNAAQYLRFHATVRPPTFAWYIPVYHPFTRGMHRVGFTHSYHYDIHRHGWRPPVPPPHGYGPHTHPPLPPYYMRTPQTPAPTPSHAWTPGVEHTQVTHTTPRNSSGSNVVPTTRPSSSGGSGTEPSSTTTSRNSGTARSGNTGTTTRSGDSGTTTSRSTGTGTTTRSGDSGTTSRSTGTGTTTRSGDTGTTSRSTGTGTTTRGTGTTPTRTNTGTTPTRTSSDDNSNSTSNGTAARTATPTRNTSASTTGTSTTTKRSTSGSTTTRNSGSNSRTTTRR